MPQIIITLKIEVDEKLAGEILSMVRDVLYATRDSGPPKELTVEISNVGGRIRITGVES